MAPRVQLQNRAQALSLPIPNLALVHTATQLATHVAGRVGQAMGFDEVLRGGQALDVPSPSQEGIQAENNGGVTEHEVPQIQGLHARIRGRIRHLMQEAGMSVSGVLQIHLDSRQHLNVDNPRPDGAGIEELLNRDPALRRDFESLASLTAGNAFSIDLTSHGPVANMIAPGGYPNW